jgi:HEAT repeat protein
MGWRTWWYGKKLSDSYCAETRATAARRLGRLKDPQAVECLLGALQDKDISVRRIAVEALGGMKDDRVAEPLLQMLSDWNLRKDVQNAITSIISPRMVSVLIDALINDDYGIRNSSLSILECLEDEPVVPCLVKALCETSNERLKICVIELLSKRKEASIIDSLLSSLADRNEDVRSAAAKALANFKDARTIESLHKSLNDHSCHVYSAAAETLAKLRDERSIEPLIEFLYKSDIGFPESVGKALIALPYQKVTNLLLEALSAEEPKVRRIAVELLGKRKEIQALKPLGKSAQDADVWVRIASAKALGNLRDRGATEPLIHLLADVDNRVREVAVVELGNLQEPSSISHLVQSLRDDETRVRMAAVEALGKFQNPEAVEPLTLLLNDEDPEIRSSAARALANKKAQPIAMEMLVAAMLDKDYNVQISAARTMESWGCGRWEAIIIGKSVRPLESYNQSIKIDTDCLVQGILLGLARLGSSEKNFEQRKFLALLDSLKLDWKEVSGSQELIPLICRPQNLARDEYHIEKSSYSLLCKVDTKSAALALAGCTLSDSDDFIAFTLSNIADSEAVQIILDNLKKLYFVRSDKRSHEITKIYNAKKRLELIVRNKAKDLSDCVLDELSFVEDYHYREWDYDSDRWDSMPEWERDSVKVERIHSISMDTIRNLAKAELTKRAIIKVSPT